LFLSFDYVQLTLDARGNVTESRAVAKPGSGLADIVAGASYPADCSNPATCNQPVSTTDARGNVTNYVYDSIHGGLLSVTAPAAPNGVRPQTRYSYSLVNGEYQLTGVSACQTQSSCAGTADEVKTSLAYDSNGNVASVSSGSGDGSLTAGQAMTYDAKGDLVTVDGPLSGSADTIRLRYNGARQVVGTISPDPDGGGPLKHRAQRVSYGAWGQATKAESGTVASQSDANWAAFSPLEAVETGCDGNARPVTQKLLAGGTTYALTHTGYDALGRPECTAQRMNPMRSDRFQPRPAAWARKGASAPTGSSRASTMRPAK
jgi:YD repeat-containing protein